MLSSKCRNFLTLNIRYFLIAVFSQIVYEFLSFHKGNFEVHEKKYEYHLNILLQEPFFPFLVKEILHQKFLLGEFFFSL